MSKKSTGIIIGIAAVLVVIGLFTSGQARIIWGSASTKTATNAASDTAAVCGTDTVQLYNTARAFIVRDGEQEPSVDEAGLSKLATSIKAMSGYETDPTCQTMLFWTAYYNKNHEDAKSAYDAIKSLHDQRIFADTNLLGVASLKTYESAMNSLIPSDITTRGTNGD